MLSILLLAALSLRGSVEAMGPRGFLARIGSISLWIADFSDSSFLTVLVDFWRTKSHGVTDHLEKDVFSPC